jgi:hypothetical protein
VISNARKAGETAAVPSNVLVKRRTRLHLGAEQVDVVLTRIMHSVDKWTDL